MYTYVKIRNRKIRENFAPQKFPAIQYDIQVLDDSHEDILWVLLDSIREEDREDSVVVCVCYLPLLSRVLFDSMIDSLHQYCGLGSVIICRDLNVLMLTSMNAMLELFPIVSQ